jgi:hypothetical protein
MYNFNLYQLYFFFIFFLLQKYINLYENNILNKEYIRITKKKIKVN